MKTALKRLDNIENTACVRVTFSGTELMLCEGANLAAELLAAGITPFRHTPKSGAPRNPFCMMGACFECLISADGKSVPACMTTATPDLVLKKIDDPIGRDDGF